MIYIIGELHVMEAHNQRANATSGCGRNIETSQVSDLIVPDAMYTYIHNTIHLWQASNPPLPSGNGKGIRGGRVGGQGFAPLWVRGCVAVPPFPLCGSCVGEYMWVPPA